MYRIPFATIFAFFIFLPAGAETVKVTVSGTLTLLNAEADIYSLDGANFLAEYRYDTAAAPSATQSIPGLATNFFGPQLAHATFTNRPNANDAVSSIQISNGMIGNQKFSLEFPRRIYRYFPLLTSAYLQLR